MRALLFAISLACAGCVTVPVPPDLTTAERHALVADTAALLGEQFPAATTAWHIGPGDSPLAAELAASLREKGFGIDAPTAAICTISITPVDPNSILLRITVAEDWGASRLYQREAGALSAESAFSVCKREVHND